MFGTKAHVKSPPPRTRLRAYTHSLHLYRRYHTSHNTNNIQWAYTAETRSESVASDARNWRTHTHAKRQCASAHGARVCTTSARAVITRTCCRFRQMADSRRRQPPGPPAQPARRLETWPGDIQVYYDNNGNPIIPPSNDHEWPVDMETGEVADPFELDCWTKPKSRSRLNELLRQSVAHEMASRKASKDYAAAKTRMIA